MLPALPGVSLPLRDVLYRPVPSIEGHLIYLARLMADRIGPKTVGRYLVNPPGPHDAAWGNAELLLECAIKMRFADEPVHMRDFADRGSVSASGNQGQSSALKPG